MSETEKASRAVPHDFSHVTLHAVPGYQAIVDLLRRELSLGRLRPGDRLPSERRLAEQLGVARETVRQALRVLEGSGQIVITRGASGGPVVQETVPDRERLLRELRARTDEIQSLTEFRVVIESAAAELAAPVCTPDDIASLRAANARLAAATTLTDSRAADTEFHLLLAALARNPYLTDAIEDARARMFAPVDVLSFEFIRESSVHAHDEIIGALAAHDAAAAGGAMRAHVRTTRNEFDRILGDANS